MGFEKQGLFAMSNYDIPKGGSDCPELGKGPELVIFVGEDSVTIMMGGAIHELGVGGFGR
jgi:hypothetical protein